MDDFSCNSMVWNASTRVKNFAMVRSGSFFFNRRYCVLGSSGGPIYDLAWINAHSEFPVWLFFNQDV